MYYLKNSPEGTANLTNVGRGDRECFSGNLKFAHLSN